MAAKKSISGRNNANKALLLNAQNASSGVVLKCAFSCKINLRFIHQLYRALCVSQPTAHVNGLGFQPDFGGQRPHGEGMRRC
jgi:hypothetical protein